ncbi:type 2 periplasmic-binding domain-containing protein [Planctobacterium marinum]|uniref:diguanylate cyclase n=1 Tax=Planctobacterium marinum TaxID=1631968 RepID=UPI001E322A6A|nr:diguanylate cyclase [Planctobacterium marinum]MCC2606910.1 diguanylate cyclase [Planctobacterium marinum]
MLRIDKLFLIGICTTGWLLLVICFNTQANEYLIVHPKSNDPKENLIAEILKLALSKTKDSARYQFQPLPNAQTEGRSMEMLKEGGMSVMWAGTQKHYEQSLLPIRIPVLKGMLGHRIFIIRQGEESRYSKVNNLVDLQRFSVGQGRFWGDTVVLKHAGLNVVTPVKYESLFPMLEGGRFDLFPRAIHEPWSEVSARTALNLSIEPRLLLIYPFAMYFFVAPDNQTLAQAIERGFNQAIEDGSYDQLFFAHPMIKDAITLARLQERVVIRLENPNMSDQTPLEDERLWLNIEQLRLSNR